MNIVWTWFWNCCYFFQIILQLDEKKQNFAHSFIPCLKNEVFYNKKQTSQLDAPKKHAFAHSFVEDLKTHHNQRKSFQFDAQQNLCS